jgi:hypothetical protein
MLYRQVSIAKSHKPTTVLESSSAIALSIISLNVRYVNNYNAPAILIIKTFFFQSTFPVLNLEVTAKPRTSYILLPPSELL